MFIKLIKPEVVDVFRSGVPRQPENERSELRIKETGAPGRLWLGLVFNNDDEIRAFCNHVLAALDKEVSTGV